MSISDKPAHKFTKKQQAELDRRYADYQNGVGKTFTWEETLAVIDKALIKKKAGKRP